MGRLIEGAATYSFLMIRQACEVIPLKTFSRTNPEHPAFLLGFFQPVEYDPHSGILKTASNFYQTQIESSNRLFLSWPTIATAAWVNVT